ncbi:MAG TPA: Type 1 glutamine amidotransferase-like domain-containing protein [Candidatus Dormibacteraeota bacterium]|nr:Type 1 glutamine amidotransferase-like domain-containing protein [Candidatus Dormibacteraeota bacterium]
MPGPIALVGSGEFTPATEDVDRALLAGQSGRVVYLPTAAALEGEERIDYWVELGRAHYQRLGVEAIPLMVLDRDDADSAGLADQVAGAGMVYLSGGNPTFLAKTLVGSRVGAAINEVWMQGSAVAGCSAGAIALTDTVPDIRRRSGPPVPGLGLVAGMIVMPHFDQIERWMPGAIQWAVEATPPGVHLIGIDEDTAMVGGPRRWQVMGRGHAWVLASVGEHTSFAAGELVSLD